MLAVVVLAAGKGKRMESDIPKVLHPLLGRPLIDYVLDSAATLHPQKTVIVVGHEQERVRAHLKDRDLQFAVQEPPLGTGHAVLQTEAFLSDLVGDIVVLSGDVPLLRSETLGRLVDIHRQRRNDATVLSAIAEDPIGYGRIVRDGNGTFAGIVEEKDAAPQIKQIKEVNSGIYAFITHGFFEYLRQIQPNSRKGEYYLTDVIAIMAKARRAVEAHPMADFGEVRGINTKEELEAAEKAYGKPPKG
ncbi:MAG: NTP transferase domain-containing protein [bacterium]